MIVTTEAVVLRVRKQGDSSLIVTLYTKEFGKLNIIAKGARQMKSPFRAVLQLFNHISVVFYKKEHRDLYVLAKAEMVAQFNSIAESLEQLTAASKVSELIQRAMHDEHSDTKLFELLLATLQHIAKDPPARAALIASYFYFHFASHEGFGLQLPLEEDSDRYILNISSGEIFTGAMSRGTVDDRFTVVSPLAIGVFRSFSRKAIPGGPVALDMNVAEEVDRILGGFLRAHIESYRKTKVY